MERPDKKLLRQAMKELLARDENTGPFYEFVSQEIYDHWKAEGKDMTYVRVNKPLPITEKPRQRVP